MSFEEEFPTLHFKDHKLSVWIHTVMAMDDLKDIVFEMDDTYLYSSKDIKEHCLDKERVKEKLITAIRYLQHENPNISNTVYGWPIDEYFLRELGLE
jgi:hypothetical protein